MRRLYIVLLAALVAVAPFIGVIATPVASQAATRVDTTTSATPNYRTFLKSDLEGMPAPAYSGGNYSCLKAQAPYTFWRQEYFGPKLSYVLDTEVGLKSGTTGIKVWAVDGYSVTLTLDEIRNPNPDGLYTILAYKKGPQGTTGGPYAELDDTEGPIRLVIPQAVVGPHGVGTDNWNRAARMVRAIEVQPTPPGLPAVDFTTVPKNEVLVYGNILNRRSFTVNQLKSIRSVTETIPWKNNAAVTGTSVCKGIPLDFFINGVVGTQSGTTGVDFVGYDGYFKQTWSLSDIRQTFPHGLKWLLAWDVDGAMTPEPGGVGPLRTIKPQEATDEVNTQFWIKWLRVIRFQPTGSEPVPDPATVPTDRIIVCGPTSSQNVPNYWYLAEGYTGGGFEEYICISNPNSWKSKVIVTYMIEGESGRTQELEVNARSRNTIKVNDVVGDGKSVSATVEGYHGDSIVVERAMYWNGRAGGHCAAGVTAPATDMYLAEGCTAAGFETWVLVQNPGDSAAHVGLSYMNAGGLVAGPSFDMAPHSRKTINVADTLPNDWQVSTKVTANRPIIAERAMYWNNRKAGHCAVGVSTPGQEWYLAEGCTSGGFETWVLVQNPGDSAAHVQLTYMNEGGPQAGPAFDMAPHSRQSINVANTLPNDWQVSTKVTADKPVIAERAVYWNGRQGGHCETAVNSPKFRSFLAEGATDGGFESWILIQNPGPIDATVFITYLTDKGAQERAPLTVPAGKRVSINEADDVGASFQVSAQVNSTAAVAVERAVYWNNRIEGTCAKGYPTW